MKTLITEIFEDDFRKLDLTVWEKTRIINDNTHYFEWIPRKLNKILDEQIEVALNQGYTSNLEDLTCPITIAIHRNNISHTEDVSYPEKQIRYGYWDKFMDRFTPESTYELGFGIKHLYSTRDYYEAHEDYWRVKKNETKVIYRVHLNKRKFVLKHKSEYQEWPYDFLPEGSSPDYKEIKLEINYDLDSDGDWKERSRCCVLKYQHSSHIIPVDKNGHQVNKII